MSLNTRTEPLENRRLSLIVEVDQERVDQELRKAARKLSRQYRIPGFRQGKAPYSVVVQYVGLPNMYSEFIDELASELYAQAVEQEKIEPYAIAGLDVSSLEPLTYTFEVPLEPTVDLGDYRSLRVEESEPEVTDEEIDERLREYQEQYAGWSDVERPSQYGDILTIDVKSVLESDEDGGDEETIVLDETDWDVTLDEENPLEPAGLDEQLLGLTPGEEKDFVLSWPEDSQSIYAGKSAQFHVKVHSVQANLEPELDDDFAQMVGPDFETLDDLKASIRKSILDDKKAEADNEYLDAALNALVEQSAMDYPPVVVEDQIDAMVNEFARQLRSYGIEDFGSYLSQTGQSIEQYRDSLREQAEIAARRNLVISELYQKEGIAVTDEEIEERIQNMTQGLGNADAEMLQSLVENMRSGGGRPVLESQIIQEKTLQRLMAIARGEELPEPAAPETVDAGDEAAADSGSVEVAAVDDDVVAEAVVEDPEAIAVGVDESVPQDDSSDDEEQDKA